MLNASLIQLVGTKTGAVAVLQASNGRENQYIVQEFEGQTLRFSRSFPTKPAALYHANTIANRRQR